MSRDTSKQNLLSRASFSLTSSSGIMEPDSMAVTPSYRSGNHKISPNYNIRDSSHSNVGIQGQKLESARFRAPPHSKLEPDSMIVSASNRNSDHKINSSFKSLDSSHDIVGVLGQRLEPASSNSLGFPSILEPDSMVVTSSYRCSDHRISAGSDLRDSSDSNEVTIRQRFKQAKMVQQQVSKEFQEDRKEEPKEKGAVSMLSQQTKQEEEGVRSALQLSQIIKSRTESEDDKDLKLAMKLSRCEQLRTSRNQQQEEAELRMALELSRMEESRQHSQEKEDKELELALENSLHDYSVASLHSEVCDFDLEFS